MNKERLTAFSDGVIAVIITIMVLEMKVPHGSELAALLPLAPVFGSYVLSFVYVGIYWNNHHHLLQAVRSINGRILWANLHLLFWLSLIPFFSGWMGENYFETLPVALYGAVLFMCGIAYYILSRLLIAHHGRESNLAIALGNDRKGIVSVLLYIVAIPLAFFSAAGAFAVYVLVAAIWFIPDSRIERMLRR
jgi:TMEM175 potassium channel family protein